MRVFGFDVEKRVFAVNFSPSQVVQHKIHPWELCLFHPNPIQIKVGDRTLNFSPLNNISFAYLDSSKAQIIAKGKKGNHWDKGYFGRVLGGVKECCQGIVCQAGIVSYGNKAQDEHPMISGFAQARFDQAWLKYLRRAPEGQATTTGNTYTACKGDAIVLETGNLRFRCKDQDKIRRQQDKPRFGGEMFAERRLTRSFPAPVSAVFEHFADWHPWVYGGALCDILTGRQARHVNFFVDKQELKVYEEKLSQLGAVSIYDCSRDPGYDWDPIVFEFVLKGMSYQMVARGNVFADRFWGMNDLSVTQLRAERQHEIIASRIALWDMGQKQARYVATAEPDRWELRANCFASTIQRRRWLQERGYRLLAHYATL